MRIRLRPPIVVLALLMGLSLSISTAGQVVAASTGYDALVALFAEWRVFQQPQISDGVPDYTASAMAAQARELADWQARLATIDPQTWPVDQQIDYYLVWAEMNGLEFDHRVLEPWARDPAFYVMLIDSESDTPLKEGPVIAGAVELWREPLPLNEDGLQQLRSCLRAIPPVLEQARGNLVGEAHDLWRLGIRTQEQQIALLEDLAERLSLHHPELVDDADRARLAVEEFRRWLIDELPSRNGPSGIGVENYDWYLRNVHLVPFDWHDELLLMERELARSVSQLALTEHRNRALTQLEPPTSAEEWKTRNEAALVAFLRFLDEEEILYLEDYMEPALRAQLQPWAPPGQRPFFTEVNLRDPRVLDCHFIHWIEKANLVERPNASPIRQRPALYNIWDTRSEGLATAMEEMMLEAGMFADSPRSRELVYVMIAMRAARAIAGLRVQSNEWTLDEAIRFATSQTPRGWFRAAGDLVVFEQQLYLRQPGYGTSYLTGKAMIDDLLAEMAATAGPDFVVADFFQSLFDVGVIPPSLVRWKLFGSPDWLPALR